MSWIFLLIAFVVIIAMLRSGVAWFVIIGLFYGLFYLLGWLIKAPFRLLWWIVTLPFRFFGYIYESTEAGRALEPLWDAAFGGDVSVKAAKLLTYGTIIGTVIYLCVK